MTHTFVRRLLAALVIVTAFTLGCRDGGITGPDGIPPGSGRLSVVAMFELNTATSLVIEVTAPDIPQALVFNLDIVNGSATGSVTIPASANRTITVRAFDGRTETHRGSRTVTIVRHEPGALDAIAAAGGYGARDRVVRRGGGLRDAPGVVAPRRLPWWCSRPR